jgi:hypothetical protein
MQQGVTPISWEPLLASPLESNNSALDYPITTSSKGSNGLDHHQISFNGWNGCTH